MSFAFASRPLILPVQKHSFQIMRVPLRLPLCTYCLLLTACASSTSHESSAKETRSVEGAQHAFFPDRYDYRIADFVLSLPIGYYENTFHRLAFANYLLHEATPKPVLEQDDYLELPAGALDPKRQFLLLDQHHILIHDEPQELVTRTPAELTVLKRDDAAWTNVTSHCLPSWAAHPDTFAVQPGTKRIQLSFKEPVRRVILEWTNGKFSNTSQPE